MFDIIYKLRIFDYIIVKLSCGDNRWTNKPSESCRQTLCPQQNCELFSVRISGHKNFNQLPSDI